MNFRPKFRFSLRTLVLLVLLVASAETLYYHREAWRLVRVWREPLPPGEKEFPFEITPHTSLADHGKFALTRDAGACRVLNLSTGHAVVLDESNRILSGGKSWQALDDSSIAFSADGRFIATFANNWRYNFFGTFREEEGPLEEPDWVRKAIVWDAQTGRQLLAVEHGRAIRKLKFSDDSRSLLSIGERGPGKLWQLSDGSLLKEVPINHDEPWRKSDPHLDCDGKAIVFDGASMPWLLSPVEYKASSSFGGIGLYKKDGSPNYPLCQVVYSRDCCHCAAFLDTGPEVWRSNDPEHRFRLGALAKNGDFFSVNCEIAFVDDRHLVALSDDTLALWTYQHSESRFGVLFLPEFWLTVIFSIALVITLISRHVAWKGA